MIDPVTWLTERAHDYAQDAMNMKRAGLDDWVIPMSIADELRQLAKELAQEGQ